MKRNKNSLIVILTIAMFFAILAGCSDQEEFNDVPEEILVDEPDLLAEVINKMTLRQKIAGLIIIGLDETTVNDLVRQRFSDYPFGGVIIYERNYIREDWLKDFISELQALSLPDSPLLVCIDEEGGFSSRLPGERFPSAAELAKMEVEEAVLVGEAIAERLTYYGIIMNFAPVLDVNIDPRNKVIGNRSFGSDPEVVSRYGLALFQGMASHGIISVGKHYPGHGSTLVDSHFKLPVLEKSKKELLEFELIPFRAAVEAGIPAIMTAHLVVSGIDDKPATMSKKMIDILRNDLGFQGVIISDDLEMGALTENFTWTEIVTATFMAGVDLLLIGHNYERQIEAVHVLEKAYTAGLITDERLDSSLRRVLEMQSQ
jgi:beta-N-acetylhexosaminidase